jgi:hypothetical protein
MEAPVTKPPVNRSSKIRSSPDLVRKEILAALVALTAVSLVSAVWDAPLQGPADPQGIPAQDVKAPWIFVGIQQMLRFASPFLAGVVIPVAALLIIATLAYLPQGKAGWRITSKILFFALLLIGAALTLWGYFT